MYDEYQREIILPPKIEDKENVEKIKSHNVVLFNSKDRNHLYDTNFNFSITFSPNSEFSNITSTYINNNFKNIVEVHFLKLIVPNIYIDQLLVNALFQEQIINEGNIISTLSPFIIERNNYVGTYKPNAARTAATNNIKPIKFERLSDLPYLLLNISEIQNTNFGTNKEVNKSSFILVLDDTHDKVTNNGSLALNANNVLVSQANYSQDSVVGNEKKILHFKTLGDLPIIYYPNPLQYIKNLNFTITTPEGKILSNLNEFVELSTVRASNLYTNIGKEIDTEQLRTTLETGIEIAITEIGIDNGNETTGGATFLIANAVSGTKYNSAAIIAAYDVYEDNINNGRTASTTTKINEPFRSHLIDLVITDALNILESSNATDNFIILTTKKWFSSDEFSVGTKILFKNINFNTTTSTDTSTVEQATPDYYIVNSEALPFLPTNANSNIPLIDEGNNWYLYSSNKSGYANIWHFYTPSTDTWTYDFANREFNPDTYDIYGNDYITAGANSANYGSATLEYQTNRVTSNSFSGSYKNFIGSTNYPSNPNSIFGSSGGSYGDSSSTNTGQTTTGNENIGGQRQFEKELFIKFLQRSEGHTIIGLEHSVNLPDSSDLDEFGNISSSSTFKSTDIPTPNPSTTRLFDCFFIPFDYKLDYNVSSNSSATITIINDFALSQTANIFGGGIGLNLSMQNNLFLDIVTERIDFTKIYSTV